MKRFFSNRGLLSVVLASACLFALRPANLQAVVVPPQATASSAGGSLFSLLDNPEVTQRLENLGYQREQVRELLSSLTPSERAALEEKVELLTGGGSVLGALLVIVLVAVVVGLILNATGHQLRIETKAGN